MHEPMMALAEGQRIRAEVSELPEPGQVILVLAGSSPPEGRRLSRGKQHGTLALADQTRIVPPLPGDLVGRK
jgi:hypothetical protein